MEIKNVILATGLSSVDDAISSKIARGRFSKTCLNQEDVYRELTKKSDSLIILSQALKTKSSIYNFIHEIKGDFPEARIIFLSGEDDFRNNPIKTSNMASLVRAGIYDLIPGKSIKLNLIQSCIDEPMKFSDVSHYIEKADEVDKKKSAINEFIDIEEEDLGEESKESNLFVISSIKPGTGKSFVTVNMAMGLAKYAIKKDGKKPKVAIIEGDLQNLSVGTLLRLQNKEKNLKTVMEKIDTVLDENGNLVADSVALQEVERFIESSFLKTELADNLYALVGSEMSFSEANAITADQYTFLLEVILPKFDIVIFDTNSAINHSSTLPAMARAKYIYYILNLDYNNVKNNARYRKDLKSLGLLDKIKYILNEDLTDYKSTDTLAFDARSIEDSGFPLSGKIPIVDKIQFLNAITNGIPIVAIDDESLVKVRYEFLRIANEIWEVEELGKLEAKANKDKKTGKLFKW